MPDATVTTALVVEVPEAEDAVGAWRAELDPWATGGVPSHVTILFPFMAVEEIDPTVCARVRAAIAAQPAFDYRFAGTGWFGDRVVWLAPDEPGHFVRLTEAVAREFPDHPPYAGAFGEIVPHLTVGNTDDPARLREAEAGVAGDLPVEGRATHVSLLVFRDGRWERRERFPLAGV